MRLPRSTIRMLALALPAALLLAWPAGAAAAGIAFQNGMKTSIYIEAASLVRGRVIRDAPLLIRPGKVGTHMNVPPGNRAVRIYDANRPARVLFQGTIPVAGQNLLFTVVPDPQAKNRATLTPAKP